VPAPAPVLEDRATGLRVRFGRLPLGTHLVWLGLDTITIDRAWWAAQSWAVRSSALAMLHGTECDYDFRIEGHSRPEVGEAFRQRLDRVPPSFWADVLAAIPEPAVSPV
jgi:hypothetical protein